MAEECSANRPFADRPLFQSQPNINEGTILSATPNWAKVSRVFGFAQDAASISNGSNRTTTTILSEKRCTIVASKRVRRRRTTRRSGDSGAAARPDPLLFAHTYPALVQTLRKHSRPRIRRCRQPTAAVALAFKSATAAVNQITEIRRRYATRTVPARVLFLSVEGEFDAPG